MKKTLIWKKSSMHHIFESTLYPGETNLYRFKKENGTWNVYGGPILEGSKYAIIATGKNLNNAKENTLKYNKNR